METIADSINFFENQHQTGTQKELSDFITNRVGAFNKIR